MEEQNQKQQHKNDNRRLYNISIVLSFTVALFAIVSLIAVGFNQVSYANPATSIPDSFTMHQGDVSVASGLGNDSFFVPIYYAGSGTTNQVFCIGKHSQLPGSSYTKSSEMLSNEGLFYILNKSAINGGAGIVKRSVVSSQEHYNYLETYATQVAIWLYLNDEEVVGKGAIVNASTYYLDDGTASGTTIYNGNLYTTYIQTVVNEARNAGSTNVKKLSVTSVDDKISEVTGTDYYQTSAISVSGTPSGDLKSYSVSISGVDGAFVVGEDGKEITDLSNLAPTQKFYVRFLKSKVTEEKKMLNISVKGKFKNYISGVKYTCANKQDLVYVVSGDVDVPGGKSIEVVGSPDTGMSTAQTIYFIGLIVLLCGVGIVYANAKPIKNN